MQGACNDTSTTTFGPSLERALPVLPAVEKLLEYVRDEMDNFRDRASGGGNEALVMAQVSHPIFQDLIRQVCRCERHLRAI